MIVEAIAAAVIALGSPVAWFTVARPALHAHRYARCLANIERLEIELGYRAAPAVVMPSDGHSWRVMTQAQAVEAWQSNVKARIRPWYVGVASGGVDDWRKREERVKAEQNAWKVKHASGREP